MTTTTAPTPVQAGAPSPVPNKRHHRPSDWVLLIVAIIVGIGIVAPFVLILLNAFKSPSDYGANGALSIPKELYFTGIKNFWNQVDFPVKLWNSIFISGVVAIGGVLLSVINAYALGIGKIRGRTSILLVFLLANMLPQEGLLYPLYIMFKRIGLYDTTWSVIIIFVVIQSAFGTYLLSSVFATFPKELLEAAALDGASRWRILWRVVVPIARPTMNVLLIFFFIWTWNEFLIPLVMLVSNAHQTVPLAIAALQGQRVMDVTTTAGACLIGLIPTLLFFLFFQRTLTRGITVGAVK